MIHREVVFAFALALIPQMAWAQESRLPEWWEVATGVLAIPAAFLGLVYSYLLLKKTRLESRKTELEIHEKETKLRKIAAADPGFVQELLQPVINARAGQILILRFIILYLVLFAWDLLGKVFALVLTGTAYGVIKILGHEWEDSLLLILPFAVLRYLPEVAYWATFLLLGWPLFRDINSVIGLDVADFFSLRRLKSGASKSDNDGADAM